MLPSERPSTKSRWQDVLSQIRGVCGQGVVAGGGLRHAPVQPKHTVLGAAPAMRSHQPALRSGVISHRPCDRWRRVAYCGVGNGDRIAIRAADELAGEGMHQQPRDQHLISPWPPRDPVSDEERGPHPHLPRTVPLSQNNHISELQRSMLHVQSRGRGTACDQDATAAKTAPPRQNQSLGGLHTIRVVKTLRLDAVSGNCKCSVPSAPSSAN